MTVYRKRRGRESEIIVAAYLARTIWPHAEPTGSGTPGRDVTGTPGVQLEIKARAGLNLGADLRQAAGHGDGLPVLVVRLNGAGPTTIEEWPAVMRLGDLVALLRHAGYGEPIPVDLDSPTVNDQLVAAIELRELTPGQPLDGPYPASVGDVADEIVAFIIELEFSARGVMAMVRDRLTRVESAEPVNTTPAEVTR